MNRAKLAALGITTYALERLTRDSPPQEPDNTYGLPDGQPIRKTLKQWFKIQAKDILGQIPSIGAPLPTHFETLADYNDPMASAMTPILSTYWQESGEKTQERLGLDPDDWKVSSPHLKRKIQTAALDFCDETNSTTSLLLEEALTRLRQELMQGLVDEGESIPQLRDRVQKIFDAAEEWRAERIARTEAARAVHAAQLESAKQSEVVAGLEWLVSADACPICMQIAAEVRQMPLGQSFAVVGNNPTYQHIKHPPAHPHCMCAAIEMLKPEYGGPENPTWGQTLVHPDPPENYTPPEGTVKPYPQPGVFQPGPDKPKPAKPKPAPKPKPAKPKPVVVVPPVATPPPPPPSVVAPPPKPAPAPPGFFPGDPIHDVEVVKKLGGSTGAELVKDKQTGKLFVRKFGSSPGHLREENAADSLYRALGVDVPDSRLYDHSGIPVKLAEFHDGKTLAELRSSDPAAAKKVEAQLRKGFAVDALLGNWDVIGMSADNVLVTKGGRVLRIDNGGSLRYRAQGKLKGPGLWSEVVGETTSLRDPKVNPAAASVFKSLTDAEVRLQISDLLKQRQAIVDAAPTDLKADLGKRLDWLANPTKFTIGLQVQPSPSQPVSAPGKGAWKPTPEAQFKTFANFDETKKWAQGVFGPAAQQMTSTDINTMKKWSGSYYGPLNSYLRGGKGGNKAYEAFAKKLDSALSKGKLPEGITVWRGMGLQAAGINRSTLKPGDDLTDIGFTATTIRKGKAFSGDKIEIRLPAGTPGFYLNAARASGIPDEEELLLPRSVNRFRIIEVTPDKIICEAIL